MQDSTRDGRSVHWLHMKNETTKSAIVGGWVLTLGAVAMSVNLASIGGWSLLLAVGLVPPETR